MIGLGPQSQRLSGHGAIHDVEQLKREMSDSWRHMSDNQFENTKHWREVQDAMAALRRECADTRRMIRQVWGHVVSLKKQFAGVRQWADDSTTETITASWLHLSNTNFENTKHWREIQDSIANIRAEFADAHCLVGQVCHQNSFLRSDIVSLKEQFAGLRVSLQEDFADTAILGIDGKHGMRVDPSTQGAALVADLVTTEAMGVVTDGGAPIHFVLPTPQAPPARLMVGQQRMSDGRQCMGSTYKVSSLGAEIPAIKRTRIARDIVVAQRG